ncbi:MAG: ATP-binding protein [Deltaproteobacteria bacterium]|nr:ATP-binding protein [Deltaproteobacteria bacterium]
MLDFTNRKSELIELDLLSKKPGLIVLFGRRRVGKTRLLSQWFQNTDGLYSQCIESDPKMQLLQIYQDIRSKLKTDIVPKNWPEFFEILELQNKKIIFCIDEFPYF